MELFQSKDEYIVQSGDRALWCSRKDGSLSVRAGRYGRCPGRSIYEEPVFVSIKHKRNLNTFILYSLVFACMNV